MARASYMRNVITGSVIPVPDDQTYLHLQAQRQDNEPVWEDATTEQAIAAGLLTDEGTVLAVTKVVPAVAAGNDQTTPLGVAEQAGAVSKVEYFPAANITGAATNFRTVAVKDGGTTVATLDFSSSGVTATANTAKVIPLSGTPSVAEGDSLSFVSTHAGTGIADPGGLVVVTYDKQS